MIQAMDENKYFFISAIKNGWIFRRHHLRSEIQIDQPSILKVSIALVFKTIEWIGNNKLLLVYNTIIGRNGMKWLFMAGLYLLTCGGQIAASQDHAVQIEQIEAQIKELKEMKRGYEARAIRAENQADRLQFEDHFVLETRRYYRIADENREKAEKIQEEIDRLEAQKAGLLK